MPEVLALVHAIGPYFLTMVAPSFFLATLVLLLRPVFFVTGALLLDAILALIVRIVIGFLVVATGVLFLEPKLKGLKKKWLGIYNFKMQSLKKMIYLTFS